MLLREGWKTLWRHKILRILFWLRYRGRPPLGIDLAANWKWQSNRLLSLPTELLVSIIDEVDLDDMENLSLSCKQMYCLTHNLVEELKNHHLEVARRATLDQLSQYGVSYYSQERCGNPFCDVSKPNDRSQLPSYGLRGFHPSELCPLSWISYLDEKPRLVDFITTLSPAIPLAPHNGWVPELPCEISEAVSRNLDKAPIKFRNRRDVLNTILKLNWDAAVALLLCILPNLRELSLGSLGSYPGDACLIEWVIREVANGKRGNSIPRVLARLSLARLCDFGSLNLAAALASLPSIRELRIAHLGKESFNFAGWTFNQSSRLTALHVDHCDPYTARIALFLRGLPKLQKFHYVGDCHTVIPYSTPVQGRSPLPIIIALRETCRESLEMLYLGLNALSRDMAEESAMFLGSLRDFPKLRRVSTETRFLVQDGVVQRIIDVFPPSLEALRLSAWRTDTQQIANESAVALLKDLPLAKAEFLPNLEHVILISGMVDKLIKQACRVQGVNVVTVETLPSCWYQHPGQSVLNWTRCSWCKDFYRKKKLDIDCRVPPSDLFY